MLRAWQEGRGSQFAYLVGPWTPEDPENIIPRICDEGQVMTNDLYPEMTV